MTCEEKTKLFQTMLDIEHKEQDNQHYTTEYFHQANGAFAMLQALGISSEYINWAIGK